MPSAGHTAIEELDSLLSQGRISEEDYRTLLSAMETPCAKETPHGQPGASARLTRNQADRQLGGVCAGLGHHFGIDPWRIRFAFLLALLLTGGTATVVCLLLLLALPWDAAPEKPGARLDRGATGFGLLLAGILGYGLVLEYWVGQILDTFARNAGRELPAVYFANWAVIHYLFADPVGVLLLAGMVVAAFVAFQASPVGGIIRRVLPRALILLAALHLTVTVFLVVTIMQDL